MIKIRSILSLLLLLPTLASYVAGPVQAAATTSTQTQPTAPAVTSTANATEKEPIIREGSYGLKVGDTIRVVKVSDGDNEKGIFPARVLQGVINKTEARVYFQVGPIVADDVDTEAVQREILQTYGKVKLVTLTPSAKSRGTGYASFFAMFEKYGKEIKNIYVYSTDPKYSTTMNIAAMLASRNQGVAVDQTLLRMLKARGCKLPVTYVMKHCGFTEKDDYISMNKWIAENMVEGSNPDMVFCLHPMNREKEETTNLPWTYDLAVATGSLIYYVDPTIKESRDVQTAILSQFRDNIPVIGWSSWKTEHDYVSAICKNGKFVCCADWGFANGSIWAAFPPFNASEYSYSGEKLSENLSYEPGTVNISMMFSDGDAWHYATRELVSLWKNEMRGQIPMAWTIPSQFATYHPLLLRWLYDTRTENDIFVQGPSGIGYIYPSLFKKTAYDEYLELTRKGLETMGMDVVNYWDLSDYNAMVGVDDSLKEKYIEKTGVNILLLGHSSHTGKISNIGETLVVEEVGDFNGCGIRKGDDVAAAIKNIRRVNKETPIYICLNIEAWGERMVAVQNAMVAMQDKLDKGSYKICSIYEMAAGLKK